jgi:hypothetical protein
MGQAINTMDFPYGQLCKVQATPTLIEWRSKWQSHNKSFCSGSVMAGRILSVVLHSTLATHELSSCCSHPPSSANQRCSNAPATLHSATLHSHPSFRRTDNLPATSSSTSNRARAATPHLPLVELQLPSVQPLTIQQNVERQPATISLSNRTPNDHRPIPLRLFNTRLATTRPTAHLTVPPKHHVVKKRHPQVQQIVTDLLTNSIDARHATTRPTAHRTALANVTSHK